MTGKIGWCNFVGVMALVLLVLPHAIHAGELSLFPEQGTYGVGEEFQIRIVANTGTDAVSAIEAELTFDPKILEIRSISTEGSVLSLWSKSPIFSNTTGAIQFSGWARENFTGTKRLVMTINATPARAAASSVVFTSGAMLAGGINTLTSMKGGAYSSEARSVPATPAPVEDVIPTLLVEEAVPVAPPIFTEVPTVLQEGERIIVRGTTVPSARVFIWTKENDAPAFRADIMSAADGTFTYVSDTDARAGRSFEIWAEAQTPQGVQSGESSHIRLQTPLSGLAAAIALSDMGIPPVYGWTVLFLLVFLGLWWFFLNWKRERE